MRYRDDGEWQQLAEKVLLLCAGGLGSDYRAQAELHCCLTWKQGFAQSERTATDRDGPFTVH